MIYSIYEPSTGQILSTISNSLDELLPDNAVAGSYTDQLHYVDIATKIIVDKPVQPGADYEWNPESKIWQLNIDQLSVAMRQQRNGLLSAVDRVNPIWYSALTADQQQELQQYRTQLLNVPQQSGFPTEIEWPTKPAWL